MADENPRGGLQHHYIHGLCFDSMWSYQIQSRAGRKGWARLEPGRSADPKAAELDPEGASWCVRGCASVLGLRPVSLTRMKKLLGVAPDMAQVAAALVALLPGFDVRMQTGLNQTELQGVIQEIQAGGSMLVRLARVSTMRQTPSSWMWVVGVELRPAWHCALSATGKTAKDPGILALLLAGRGFGAPWASGYGAKAIEQEGAIWSVRSVDGQTWRAVVSCAVRIFPR